MKAVKKPWAAIAAALLSLSACGRSARGAERPEESAFEFKSKPSSRIVFLSTQLNPVEEAGKMRSMILKDFPGQVDFRPNDNGFLAEDIEAAVSGGAAASVLVGALHGDLAGLYERGRLRALDDVIAGLGGRRIQKDLLDFAKLDGRSAYYVPWMQASFVMAADKKALAYLPEGASLDELSYGQLLRWAINVREAAGKSMLGFPAGNNGLFHRFFQGYLYPSFTGKTLKRFKSEDAERMWGFFADLWKFVNPASLGYTAMSEPLLAGDVWIAWDHTARLAKAFEEAPDRFVAFPAPAGPFGRGFMPVISGLAIPVGASKVDDQAVLIDYLTRERIQAITLRETGFFPVLDAPTASGGGERSLADAVQRQAGTGRTVPTLMPVGLGKLGADYNRLFVLTFSEIVLSGMDARGTLQANAALLQALLDEGNVASWPPDPPGERPCQIE